MTENELSKLLDSLLANRTDISTEIIPAPSTKKFTDKWGEIIINILPLDKNEQLKAGWFDKETDLDGQLLDFMIEQEYLIEDNLGFSTMANTSVEMHVPPDVPPDPEEPIYPSLVTELTLVIRTRFRTVAGLSKKRCY